MCHGTTELAPIHGNDCALCHDGAAPAESFETWSGSCSQGACHPTIVHASPDAAHNALDCEAACHGPSYIDGVPLARCSACHLPIATLAPATTSDARSSYVGSAVITFSSPGAATTYYRLDGGAIVSGTSVAVPGPDAGIEAHVLEYWSVGASGIEEAPHRSVAFSISADTEMPRTTSDAQASYIGPAVITLAVTDNGSQPVPLTQWRLDDGPVMTGTRVEVAPPGDGTQSHSLEYWSVDASGNEELPHNVVQLLMIADTTPPTGTIAISGGQPYTIYSAVWLLLSAADDGELGVPFMRFSLDGLAWGEWEPFSTHRYDYPIGLESGVRTVWVQFRDGAGNVSAPISDTIYRDGVAPTGTILIDGGAASTYSSTVTLSLSATDTGSGVTQMRFWNRDDAGRVVGMTGWEPYATSKVWTLIPGTGLRRVIVDYRDAAGNSRSYLASITVLAESPPP